MSLERRARLRGPFCLGTRAERRTKAGRTSDLGQVRVRDRDRAAPASASASASVAPPGAELSRGCTIHYWCTWPLTSSGVRETPTLT